MAHDNTQWASWGNSVYPDFEFNPPGVWDANLDGYLLGQLYTIDRTAAPFRSSYISTATPSSYYRTTFPTGVASIGGALTTSTIDLLGIYLNPTTGPWPAPSPYQTSPLEGVWDYHYDFYSDQRYQNDSYTFNFGVDLTPPRAMTGLHIKTGLSGSDVATWQPATRAVISWDATNTDDLSGLGYLQILLDGQPYVPETSSTPTLGRMYYVPGEPTPTQLTIESAPPGHHVISVQPVDRATNAGPITSAQWWSDPDTPTISWADPVGNVLDPRSGAISVNASDLAGDPTVAFKLNGSAVGTVTAPPYTVTPAALSALPTGTVTISATVTDHLNRTVTLTKSVQWNPHGLAGSTTDSSMDPTGTVVDAPGSAETSTGGGTGWTNDLTPGAGLIPPDGATDIFYNVVQTLSPIDTSMLQNYYHSTVPYGPLLHQTINLKDSIDTGGPWAATPNASNKYEGTWYFQWVWYDRDKAHTSTHTYHAQYNVDITPPDQVTGFTASPTAGVWTEQRRVNLKWDAKQYDKLSGDLRYDIALDGEVVASVNATSAQSGTATIEDMPAGRHQLSIVAVDKAGNKSTPSTLWFQSDPAPPSGAFTEPTDPAMNPHNYLISVDASDDAGDPAVSFRIDGGASTLVTAPPYAILPNLTGLSTGPHVITATIADSFGHVTVLTKNVTWSASAGLTSDGDLDIQPGADLYETTTNPARPDKIDEWWRQGWGNTMNPEFTFNPPRPNDPKNVVVGMLYDVTTSPSNIITATPSVYYRTARASGTNLDQTLDMQGIYNFPPLGGWPGRPMLGATSPVEGQWWMNMIFFSSTAKCGTQTYHVPVGVDITPPSAVESMVVSPSRSSSDATDTYTTPRVYVSWNPKEYDSLSGTAYYQVLIDGQQTVPDSANNPVQGRVYNLPGVPATSATIESFPGGRHTIGVAAVDRATNMGPVASKVIWCDPDTPTVSWVSTGTTVIDPSNPKFSVNATDSSGEANVTYSLGTTATPSMFTTTLAGPAYDWAPDLSSLATGTYTLKATVRDHLKRAVTITKQMTWTPHNIAASVDPNLVSVVSAPESADTSTGGSAEGWTNDLFPVANLTLPKTVNDMFYNVVQTPSDLNPLNLGSYFHSVYPTDHGTAPDGTLFDHTIDLKDSIDAGLGTWLAGPMGSVAPYEGTWYFQWLNYSDPTPASSAFVSQTMRVRFQIDRTPPAIVTGFSLTPTAATWTSSRRVSLKWDAKEYDALSKDALYRVFVDGKASADVSATCLTAGTLTIESMPTGKHAISIAAVDKAGNVGPLNTLWYYGDHSAPTVSFTEPTSTLTPRNPNVSLNASDDAGDPTVVVQIYPSSTPTATKTLATLTAAPYTFKPDVSSYANGFYTLKATATDGMGNTAVATRDIYIDNTVTLNPDTAVDLADGVSIGTSKSNPGLETEMQTWWRQGWGNSVTPDFELVPPAPDASTYGLVIGTLYSISTSPADISPTTPDRYYRAARGVGTNLDQTIDMMGVLAYPPVGGWRSSPVAGATQPIEGQWYMNVRWFTSKGFTSSRTYHIPMGIDLTPPSAIESMAVSPTLSAADETRTIPTSRFTISWKPKTYDALSGVAYYQVYIDGQPAVPEADTNPVQGRVYEVPGVTPSLVTIENLSAGRHTIGLAAVDRATNVGPITTKTIYCDPDVPKVKIISPTGSTIGVKPTIAASASDAGGITHVDFALDGTPIAHDTEAPYSSSVDLSGFAAGNHVLTATAYDYYGRAVTAAKTVTIDKTPLTVTSLAASGSGRSIKIKFTTNRAATAKLSLSVAGTSKTVVGAAAGTFTFSYTYPKGKKYPSALNFYDTYKITVTDALGNQVVKTGKVKVTLAKLVKLANNKIKIIYY